MDDLQSEKEQIEELRQWWSENGRYVIGGIVIGAGLLFGWNKYQGDKLEDQLQASELFEELANEVADGDLDNAERIADQLAQDFGNTSYAAQSKLAMARLYMDKNRDKDAADVLNQLLGSSGHDELRNVGRLRLAKILLYQDRAQDAIDLLEDQESTAFAALYADALGDAYAAIGNVSAAEDAYQAALEGSAQGTIDRSIVQMKLIDLPDQTAAPVENLVPENLVPENLVPENLVPENLVPENNVPTEVVPAESAAESTAKADESGGEEGLETEISAEAEDKQ